MSSSSSPSAAAGDALHGVASPIPAPPRLPSSRRPPPPCWSHDETLALLDAYRDKWYSLRRGNLRAAHWQEVADAVSLLSPSLSSSPKTAVQCRHKIEKLRKRYRAEKLRSLSHDPSAPPTSSWVYFRNMDSMVRGTAPSSLPLSPSPASSDDYPVAPSTTRSLHGLMSNGGPKVPKAVRSRMVGSRAPPPRPANPYAPQWGAARRRVDKKRWEVDEGADEMGEMVAALRTLGDSFMRMEQMKMEMARETEKVRMEMELKRTEMILDCQRQIAESLANGIVAKKKKRAKVSPDS